MLRRTVPRVFDKRVPGLTSIDRSYKGAPLPFFHLRTLPDACVSLSIMHCVVIKKQHLSYFGVRLNLRETERKRRKKVDDPLSASTVGAGGAGSGAIKGKRRDDEESGYEE
jgi:hypothetical protein